MPVVPVTNSMSVCRLSPSCRSSVGFRVATLSCKKKSGKFLCKSYRSWHCSFWHRPASRRVWRDRWAAGATGTAPVPPAGHSVLRGTSTGQHFCKNIVNSSLYFQAFLKSCTMRSTLLKLRVLPSWLDVRSLVTTKSTVLLVKNRRHPLLMRTLTSPSGPSPTRLH